MNEIEAARAVLRDRPRTLYLHEIADAADVSLAWLKEFSREEGRAPSKVTRNVRRLARYFAERDA